MADFKIFAGLNYAHVRADITEWLDEHPEVEIIDTGEAKLQLEKGGTLYWAIIIIFRTRR